MAIERANEKVIEALETIVQYQDGLLLPIVTYDDDLNNNLMGGIYPQTVMTIAASSGHGKTHYLQHEVEEAMFDKTLNPQCDDYVLLRCNFEMSVTKLMLRVISKNLNKSIERVLHEKFTEGEWQKMATLAEKESNPNIYYLEDTSSPEVWYELVLEFILHHKEKKHILITIDHMALISGAAKNTAISLLIAAINKLKKHKNVSFVLVSQLNNNIEKRENPMFQQPLPSDLFWSSEILQLSDLVLILNNPYKRRINKYMLVQGTDGGKEHLRYPHLAPYMIDVDADVTSFFTKNLIFKHFVKIRFDTSYSNIKDLTIQPMDMFREDKKIDVVQENKITTQITRGDEDFLDMLD